MKKTFYAALMVMTVAMISCKSDEANPTKDPLQVTTETVALSSEYNSQSYVGVVEAESSSLVSFTGTGEIVEMAVKEGDHVRKGQLIARIDPEQAQNALDQAQYGEEQARKTEEQTANADEQAKYTQDQAQVARNQAKYTQDQAKIAQEQAKNTLDMAKATLDEALDAQARMKVLHDNNSLPEMKWVEVQTKVNQAQASYNAALKNCEQAGVTYAQSEAGRSQSDIAYKQTEVGRKQAQNTNEQSKVASKQAGVTVNMAKKNLKQCSIYAPCDGVIVTKFLGVGEVALPSQPVVKIMTDNDVKVSVSIPETDISKITETTQSLIHCAAAGNEDFVSSSLVKEMDGDAVTHTYKVKLNVKDAGSILLPGMVCSVQFSEENNAEQQITVPIKAVQQKADKTYFVWVAEKGKAHRRPVTIGETVGNRIVITSGLDEGQQVITEGYQKVDEGGQITVG